MSQSDTDVLELGTFSVESGQIGIWDPCYGHGKSVTSMPGKWTARVKYTDQGAWGRRVKSLSAYAMGYENATSLPVERAFFAGVDSGQMGIYDAVDADGFTDQEDYDGICQLTLAKQQAGIYSTWGAVSSTGLGDGSYPVFVSKNKEGDVVGIIVEFFDDVEDDREYDDTPNEGPLS